MKRALSTILALVLLLAFTPYNPAPAEGQVWVNAELGWTVVLRAGTGPNAVRGTVTKAPQRSDLCRRIMVQTWYFVEHYEFVSDSGNIPGRCKLR